jgi:long-chain fatty acid transport protein
LSAAHSIRPALDLDASAIGWRVGLAYEVPTKALRVSIMYYSNIDFSAQGTLHQLPLRGNAFLDAVPVQAEASIPRAVEARFQTAIAPAWLNTVSIRWVNWSTVTSIPVTLTTDSVPLRAGRILSTLNAFFLDGWTISDTISHRWSDNLALSLNLGWDRGVSTGWTDNADAWNAFLFANYKINDHIDGRRDRQVGAGRKFQCDFPHRQHCVHPSWVPVSLLNSDARLSRSPPPPMAQTGRRGD